MDTGYLEDLIEEAKSRGGGMVLNQDDKPVVVVMTVDKYNALLQHAGNKNHDGRELQSESAGNDILVAESIEILDYHSSNNKKILVTGGAGYIGSHTVRELVKAGYEVVVFDNLSTGKRANVPPEAKLIEGDIMDMNLLRDVFAAESFYAVMHFAASIEVEESVREPENYLQNNTFNTARLLAVMAEYGVTKFIFSSTAAVYGDQEHQPISETSKPQPSNPYGYSKLLAERLVKYYCHFVGFQAVIFRYFNACGSDLDGRIASAHKTHLIPVVMEVAAGKREVLVVNGNDYQTPDGTCVRDYIHVLDIARAHVLALENLESTENYRIYNIGTGTGFSVLGIVHAVSDILQKNIPMEFAGRRPGDSPVTIADNTKIKQELGFEPQFSDLKTIIKTTWKQLNHE